MTGHRSALSLLARHIWGSWDRDRERWIVDDFGGKGSLVSRSYVNQLIAKHDVAYSIWSRRQDIARRRVYRWGTAVEYLLVSTAIGLGIAAGATGEFWLLVVGSTLQGVALVVDAIRTKNRRWTPRWPDSSYVSRTIVGTSMENLSDHRVTNR